MRKLRKKLMTLASIMASLTLLITAIPFDSASNAANINAASVTSLQQPPAYVDENGVYYNFIDDKTASVSGATEAPQANRGIIISSVVEGRSVVSIDNYAFADCSDITDVVIPTSVNSIGAYAFVNTGLTMIMVPANMTYIGECALGCNITDDIALSKTDGFIIYGYEGTEAERYATDYGFEFFSQGKTERDFAYSIEEISGEIVAAIDSYIGTNKEVVIPDEIGGLPVRSVSGGYRTNFVNNLFIEKVVLPKSISGIGMSAFAGCVNLKSVIFPERITPFKIIVPPLDGVYGGGEFYIAEIGNFAFSGCTSLEEIVLPDGLTGITAFAFKDCTNLKKITIPASVVGFEGEVFDNCPVTIYGKSGSAAEKYAADNEITFILSSAKRMLGDIDGNNVVDAADAALALSIYAKIQTGKQVNLTEEEFIAADADKNNVIDTADAAAILKYYAYVQTGGKITSDDFFAR